MKAKKLYLEIIVGYGINDAPVLARADIGVTLIAVINSMRALKQ